MNLNIHEKVLIGKTVNFSTHENKYNYSMHKTFIDISLWQVSDMLVLMALTSFPGQYAVCRISFEAEDGFHLTCIDIIMTDLRYV